MAKNVVLTAEEIIGYLKKSDLINILVEGPDDFVITSYSIHYTKLYEVGTTKRRHSFS